jgi:hypothetical protein
MAKSSHSKVLGLIPSVEEFLDLAKKILSLFLVRSRATVSCAPLSGLGAIVDWAVDTGRDGPLVVGGQGLGFFSIGTYGSVTSYNIGEGGFTLSGRVFFIINSTINSYLLSLSKG